MSASFNLGIPTDIPWERICVSEDMLDERICDKDFPPKWHSSIAVFKYVPDEAFQPYEDLEISYLKVSATITGYQPQDKEVEGTIDWDDLDVDTIEDVESLLNEYLPCTGAILQVSVAPKNSRGIDTKDYPYFMDFEPKKRELYEMATDTRERVSRSLDNLSVGKSGSNTESLEVLDVDMGSSYNFGANFTYAGTGGGMTGGYSNQGQWGSRTMGTNQTATARTSDRSQEERETHAFTTQIAQLYHLFEAYHLGTNRAMFFVQPRPHVLEEPSGFVRGPRSIDGIQEVFLVVAQPKEQKDFCVSVRLDTAHLTEVDIMDYEYKKDSVDLSVSASPPVNANDPDREYVGNEYLDVYFIGKIGERRYRCYEKTAEAVENYIPPWSDFKIDLSDSGGYDISSVSSSHGSYSVDVAADGSNMVAKVSATSHVCKDDGGAVCLDCPDEIQKWSANSNLSLIVNLISKQPIRKIGTEQVVVITTRGLCCCKPGLDFTHIPGGIIDVISVADLIDRDGLRVGLKAMKPEVEEDDKPDRFTLHKNNMMAKVRARARSEAKRQEKMTAREANALGTLIASELQRSAGPKRKEKHPQPYLLSDLFVTKLERRMRSQARRRSHLNKPYQKNKVSLDPELIEAYTGKPIKEVTMRDISMIDRDFLLEKAELSKEAAARIHLQGLGVKFAKDLPDIYQNVPKKTARPKKPRKTKKG